MKDFKKMMGKEDDNGDMKKDAKLSVLKHLREMASGMMGDDLKSGMKKVTVASDSTEGLKEGLNKAEDVVEDMPEGMDDEMYSQEDMSLDEINAEMEHLMELKRKLMEEENVEG